MGEFDDAWYAEWIQRMVDGGGNVIAALGLRPLSADGERVVMEMPIGPNVRQGTGVFAAGPLMQLADVGATMLYQRAFGSPDAPAPFPLSVQISMNLIRNTDHGKATSESRFLHKGRRMCVIESHVRDDDGKLLCVVTSTHMPVSSQ
ncbi:MAG TPA: PaaI family thioesterase [Dehalococcoidia bacterium]